MARSKQGFTERSFSFLEGLEQNNDRDWFHENKSVFDEALERPFIDLLEDLSDRLADAEVPLRGGKKTMFRMNRDVRFSEDKRPYKTNVSGLLTPSGTKSEAGGVLYFHMDSAGGIGACGFYKMSPKALGPMRDAIVEQPEAFNRVLDGLGTAGLELARGDSLTAMPRGYDAHSKHRHAWALKLKTFITREELPKAAWTSGDVASRLERLARGSMPLIAFFGS